MVMKDLKEMFRDDKGEEYDEQDNTLFNLCEKYSAIRIYSYV